jgi:peroxiredoxin
VLIDRSGKVRWTKSGGRLTEKEARAEIGKLMAGASIAPAGARGMPTPPPDGQPGVRAPDGIGVVVAPSPGSGPMADGPWEPGSLATPLLAGASVPANSLVKDLRGKSFDLNAAIAAKPTVLVFYRGGWCPYCNAHLRELQKSAPQLQKMGYQILAVSTDTPEKLQGTLEKNQLEYTLLSDAKAAVTARFGLKYKVVSSYLDHVKNDHGTDLVAQNGGYLLTPAAYVLDRKGKIRFAYVNNNYAVRVGQDKLLQAAAEALR